MATRWFLNPDAYRFTADAGPSRAPIELHRRLPGYAPTPLLSAPSVAERLGIAEVWVKDESSRLGLPAFKTLGASWASYRAVEDRLGEEIGPWRDLDELTERLAKLRPMSLAAATDGNHGRAVARMAKAARLRRPHLRARRDGRAPHHRHRRRGRHGHGRRRHL